MHTSIFARTRHSHLAVALAALCLPGCDLPADNGGDGGDGDHIFALAEEYADRLQALEDRDAIREVAACYGRGHDVIFTDLGGPKTEAFDILSTCFTPDVHTDVYFFDDPLPVASLDGLVELVGFIEQFAIDTGYTSARNVVGDVQIELHEDDTAFMVSATATPHFIQPVDPAAVEPTVDLVTARYEDHLVRDDDGTWRTQTKVLRLDDFWRGQGSYPLGGQ
ncbi:MAG: nuclear transport factor 2 family protein [Myxococcota bacterium]